MSVPASVHRPRRIHVSPLAGPFWRTLGPQPWQGCVPAPARCAWRRRGQPRPAVFRRLSIAEGLVNNVVYGVVQDSRGFIWLGTEGGLVRYDGREFRSFELGTEPDGSRSQRHLDRSIAGRTTWSGWARGAVGSCSSTRCPSDSIRYVRDEHDGRSLSDDRVQAVFEDRSGRLWVGHVQRPQSPRAASRARSCAIRPDVPGEPDVVSHSRIWSISQGSDGLLWVGTDAGVDVLDAAGRVRAPLRAAAARWRLGPCRPGARGLPRSRRWAVGRRPARALPVRSRCRVRSCP